MIQLMSSKPRMSSAAWRVGAGMVMLLGGCSSGPDASDGPDVSQEYVIPASAASTSELGVAGWRVDLADDAYSVTGVAADRTEHVVMRLKQSANGGELTTKILLATAAGHFRKAFTTAENKIAEHGDEIASNPQAARALELMATDVVASADPDSDLSPATIQTLNTDPTLVQPPSGKGWMFGRDVNRAGCSDENLVYSGRGSKNGMSSCSNLIYNVNKDCMSAAQCSRSPYLSTHPCGGSDTQCRQDQAYARSLKCDIKCAAKDPTVYP